jgi:hypothetical protein
LEWREYEAAAGAKARCDGTRIPEQVRFAIACRSRAAMNCAGVRALRQPARLLAIRRKSGYPSDETGPGRSRCRRRVGDLPVTQPRRS